MNENTNENKNIDPNENDQDKYETKRVTVSELQEGMIIARKIYTKMGILILDKGTVLSEATIQQLRRIQDLYFVQIMIPEGSDIKMNNQISFNRETSLSHKEEQKISNEKILTATAMVESSLFSDGVNDRILKEHISKVSDFISDEFKYQSSVLENVMVGANASEEIAKHSLNVAALANMIGKWLDFKSSRLNSLTKAALLHDIGKIKLKEKNPDIDEETLMKLHPHEGFKFVKSLNSEELNNELAQGILTHHEREDGSGYPMMVKSDKINQFGKVIAVADTFENLLSKKGICPFEALYSLQTDYFGKLDMNIVIIFIKKFSDFYVGSHVILSTGEEAKIVQFNKYDIKRPLVLTDDGFIDLYEDSSVHISQFLYS